MDSESPGTPPPERPDAGAVPSADWAGTLPDELRDPPFAGPDIVFGAYRQSVIWPAVTVLVAVAAIFLVPIILGPVAIVCGLVALSRGERFSRTALAFAVVCMLAGIVFGALVLHHHHHSLISKVNFL